MDDIEYPFSRFIKKNFKHVFAIERQALGWVCFDPSRSELNMTLLPATHGDNIIPQFIKDNPKTTVIHLEVEVHDRAAYPRPAIMGCVGAIQYLLGVYWPIVFTPFQLYTKLINKRIDNIKVVKLCQVQALNGRQEKQQSDQM